MSSPPIWPVAPKTRIMGPPWDFHSLGRDRVARPLDEFPFDTCLTWRCDGRLLFRNRRLDLADSVPSLETSCSLDGNVEQWVCAHRIFPRLCRAAFPGFVAFARLG
jgi:hypothetical protein